MIIDMSSPVYEAPIDFPTIFVQSGPLPRNSDIATVDCLTGDNSGPTVIGLDAAIDVENCGCNV